jgi:hypothetical protein
MVAVEVAVRVRPSKQGTEPELIFEDRLEANGATSITIRGQKQEKQFSCDRFYGASTDQEQLFNSIGVDTVKNALNGWNTAIFAYGQTGSGKTYTMMGGQAFGKREMGIIPRVCNLLFSRIDAERTSLAVEVTASHFEVYNERVRDLCRPSEASATNLRVREHPKTGAYVERLSEVRVDDYAQVQALLDKGAHARTTAATSMNDSSSRSHAVFTLSLKITAKGKGAETGKPRKVLGKTNAAAAKRTSSTVCSKICLVDLAGSERADTRSEGGAWTEGSMERGVEAKNINQSLRALGEVVSQLALVSAQQKQQQKVKTRSRDGGEPPVVRLSLALNAHVNDDGENGENVAPNRVSATRMQSRLSGQGLQPRQMSKVTSKMPVKISGAKTSGTGGKKIHVPYRNSALTWLLKECLGGNSKTIMIGCVSATPACSTQTLSTLRYLLTARRVQTGVVRESTAEEFEEMEAAARSKQLLKQSRTRRSGDGERKPGKDAREREREEAKIQGENAELWTQNAQLLSQNAELEGKNVLLADKNARLEAQKVQAAARLEACEAALSAMDRSNKLLGKQLLDSHDFHERTSAAAEKCVRKGDERSDTQLQAVGQRVRQWEERNRALQKHLVHMHKARQDDAELCIMM